MMPNLKLVNLADFYSQFYPKYEPNKLLRSSEDSFYILLYKK